MPKWLPKSLIFHTFSKKGENAPDPLSSHINRGSGQAKSDEKSIKFGVKSILEKATQKRGKMMPNWSQTGYQKRSKIEKMPEKRHAENDAGI